MSGTLRIACLISGGGRTVLNLQDEIETGRLDASIDLVISSRRDVAGVERARTRGFDVQIVRRRDFESDDAYHDTMGQHFATSSVDLVCLCGFLQWVRVEPALAGKVINIHPALLPAHGGPGMYGDRVHAAVLAAGDAASGCTVHFVDDQYDHGPVILQRQCPVTTNDTVETLAARVFAQECIAYPEAIRMIAAGAVRWERGEAVFARGDS